MSDSLSIIFGVVPDAISAWNPEIAPHAIVMNTKGKTGPGMIGPPPPANWRERRHLQLRVDDDDADDEQRDGADLHVRAEVVARAEQHPDRQHRGDEPVAAIARISCVARDS